MDSVSLSLVGQVRSGDLCWLTSGSVLASKEPLAASLSIAEQFVGALVCQLDAAIQRCRLDRTTHSKIKTQKRGKRWCDDVLKSGYKKGDKTQNNNIDINNDDNTDYVCI